MTMTHLPSKTLTTLLALTLAALVLAFAPACGSGQRPLVFTSDRDGNLEIYSAVPGGEAETNITKSSGDQSSPMVSPNGKLVAFKTTSDDNEAIEVISLEDSSRVTTIRGLDEYRTHRWAPSGDRLAYVGRAGTTRAVYLSGLQGSEAMALSAIPSDEVGDWSRNGKTVAFAVRTTEAQGIYVRNPDGVNEVRLTETPDYAARWSPNSRQIAFVSTRDGNSDIYVMSADGSDQRRLTNTEAPEYQVSWAPDGKRLLFVSERDGDAEIFVTSLDGKRQAQLTSNTTKDEQPVWSPDGKRIAFVSYLDGDGEIFVMDADGENQVRVTNNDAQDTSPSW